MASHKGQGVNSKRKERKRSNYIGNLQQRLTDLREPAKASKPVAQNPGKRDIQTRKASRLLAGAKVK